MRANVIKTPLNESQHLRLINMVRIKMPTIKTELVEIEGTAMKKILITYENGSEENVYLGDDMFDFLMNGIKVVRISWANRPAFF